jgi:hypothetical protein
MQAFKNMDIYGDELKFRVNGRTTYKTLLGSILSLITLLFGVLIFATNISKVIRKENPSVIIQNSYSNDYPVENLTSNDFEIIMDLSESNRNGKIFGYPLPIQESTLMNQKISISDLIQSDVQPITNSSFSNCSKIDSLWSELAVSLKNRQTMNNLICSNFDGNMTLGGDFTSKGFLNLAFGQVIIDLCKIFPNCSSEWLSKQWEESNFSLTYRYINKYFNASNYLQGSGYTAISQIMQIRLDYEHLFSFRIQKNIIETDNNLLFNFYPNSFITFYTVKSLNYQSYAKTSQSKYGPNHLNIMFNANLDQSVSYYKRTYAKLDSALANSIALIKLITMLMTSINKIINFDTLCNYLISNLYREKQPLKSTLNQTELVNINNEKNSSNNVNNKYSSIQIYNKTGILVKSQAELMRATTKTKHKLEKKGKIIDLKFSLTLFQKIFLKICPYFIKSDKIKAYKKAAFLLRNRDLELTFYFTKYDNVRK